MQERKIQSRREGRIAYFPIWSTDTRLGKLQDRKLRQLYPMSRRMIIEHYKEETAPNGR